MATRVTLTLSVAETEILTLWDTVDPLDGEVMATTGAVVSVALGSELFTETVNEAVPALLAASKAFTVRVCEPLALVALFQENEKFEEVDVATAEPSTSSSTLVTPTLSVAEPWTEIVPDTLAPESGVAIETVGAVVSVVLLTVLLTLTDTAAEPVLLAASNALTLMACDPLDAPVLFQKKEKGEEVAVATAAPSTSSSIFVTPALSAAVPCTEIVPETLAPDRGAVMLTV